MTKKALAVASMIAKTLVVALALSGAARAEETKMVGVITRIDLAGPDAKTATVTLKDVKTDEEVEVVLEDEPTLDKLKDHRIVDGDEIRCKYAEKDGKKLGTYFRKTAGC